MNEYCIRFIPLPTTLKGITVEDSSGFYNIYINDSLSYEEQQKAIQPRSTGTSWRGAEVVLCTR